MEEHSFKQGDIIIEEQTYGSHFYIVKEGVCRIFIDKEDRHFSKLKYQGDYFGESAVTSDGARNANVEAYTDCILLKISKSSFFYCFGTCLKDINGKLTLYGRMKNLQKVRSSGVSEII